MNITAFFSAVTGQLANWVEIAAALIIGIAAIEATVGALLLFARRHGPPEAKEDLRLRLGTWLAVALEFELAADILRTAIAPTLNEIGLLAAVAAIRTGLNYFLQQEIDRARAGRRAATPGQAGATPSVTPSIPAGAGPAGEDGRREGSDARTPA